MNDDNGWMNSKVSNGNFVLGLRFCDEHNQQTTTWLMAVLGCSGEGSLVCGERERQNVVVT